jgi:HAD superfamily hydrolase (TIGR01509 family)
MTGLRAVAWDIDGTLVDSEGLHHRALSAVSANHGADLSDLPDRAFSGIHILDVWTALRPRFSSALAREQWLAEIDVFYARHAAEIAPMPEAIASVREISARGLPQVCVSNSNRAIVDANLDALGLGEAFAFSLSLDDVAAGKPDPAPYREACRRLALAPKTVLAVEDSIAGMRSARAAGLFVAGFAPGGARSGGCDVWITRLSETLRLIDS